MTNQFNIERQDQMARHLAENGMYLPETETANCGVGMVASIDGQPRRSVVLSAIEALGQIWHRGAVDADGKTGDGAGIHLQIPQEFFKDHIRRMGQQCWQGSPGRWHGLSAANGSGQTGIRASDH